MQRLGHLGGSVGWASAFGSGQDLRVLGSSPVSGSLLNRSLFLSLSLPLLSPAHALSLSLSNQSIKKILKIKKSQYKTSELLHIFQRIGVGVTRVIAPSGPQGVKKEKKV